MSEKKIKICYTDRLNLGDAINPLILRDVLEVEHQVSNAFSCEITGIGSGLRRYFLRMNSMKNMCRYAMGHISQKPLILWSAGFLQTPSGDEKFIRNQCEVASVRGELSRQWVEKLLHKEVNCTTGDAGLLSSLLIEPQEKKYALGIIPHVKEKQEEAFYKLHKNNPDSVIIDVEGNTIETLKTIASCETIVSSSLHGLIIADSFSVPNIHITCTDRLSGDGFKFKDYYSSFGMEHSSVDITEYMNMTTTDIRNSYAITKEMVDIKKEEIKVAFYKYL